MGLILGEIWCRRVTLHLSARSQRAMSRTLSVALCCLALSARSSTWAFRCVPCVSDYLVKNKPKIDLNMDLFLPNNRKRIVVADLLVPACRHGEDFPCDELEAHTQQPLSENRADRSHESQKQRSFFISKEQVASNK